jgi:hypothetical protein
LFYSSSHFSFLVFGFSHHCSLNKFFSILSPNSFIHY